MNGYHRNMQAVDILLEHHVVLVPVRFGQYQGQRIEEVLVKALADQNVQLGYEHRLCRELGKPKQILHVRILLDSLDGLLIAQILHMLRY